MKFRWLLGRQNPFYKKFKIYSFWRMDCYLIRCDIGCFIGYHIDPVEEGYKHYRLNIFLKGYDVVQKLFAINPLHGKAIFHWWRFIFFRPDIQEHGLGMIKREMLILSFGFKVKE